MTKEKKQARSRATRALAENWPPGATRSEKVMFEEFMEEGSSTSLTKEDLLFIVSTCIIREVNDKGTTQQEIAEILDVSQPVVSQLKNRSDKMLRTSLETLMEHLACFGIEVTFEINKIKR